MDKYEPLWDTQWVGLADTLKELNGFAHEYPLEKFVFNDSKVRSELTAIGEVCATHITALNFGKTADPVKAVNDFRAALRNAGYDKVKAEIQAQLTAFKNAR
jgi:putative aldouronate transport system substrate-binding protein